MAGGNVPKSQPSALCINNSVSLVGRTHQRAIAMIPNSVHPQARTVLVTPVPPGSTPRPEYISKLMLKAVSKVGKNSKLFTLRNVNMNLVRSCEQLKATIRHQFENDIVADDFDVGYVNGNNMISIRTSVDLLEIFSDMKSGVKVTMWCDGLQGGSTTKSKKRSRSRVQNENASDEDDPFTQPVKKKKTAQEAREESVQAILEDLREIHGSKFTHMQIRIWSEMIVGKTHNSTDDPPTCSMFVKAGKGNNRKKEKEKEDKTDKTDMTEAVTQAAHAISSAFSPPPSATTNCPSPAKVIEACSRCYKQLHDLKNLKETGVLTDDKYSGEKEAVMSVLKKLKGR